MKMYDLRKKEMYIWRSLNRNAQYNDGNSYSQKKDEDRSKAKVVASVWGTEFIQFIAALAIVH